MPRTVTFRPSRASQRRESRRLRPIAVLPALLLIGGASAGVLTADHRRQALLAYAGLVAVAVAIAVPILVVLAARNRMLLARSSFTITPETVSYVDLRGRTTTFDRRDPTLTSLLTWVEPTVIPYGGVMPPTTLHLFIADGVRQVRITGTDWDIDDLAAVTQAANGRVAQEVSTAGQVNDAIPGAMGMRELHPFAFAMAVGFGSVAALLIVVVAVALLAG